MTKRLILVGIALAAGGMSFAEDGWVQSDGTQYVDTGYRPTPKTKIVADFAYVDVTTLQQRVFGESGGNAGITFSSYINGGGNYAWAVQNHDGNWQSTDVKATADQLKNYFGEAFIKAEQLKEMATNLIVDSAKVKAAEAEEKPKKARKPKAPKAEDKAEETEAAAEEPKAE